MLRDVPRRGADSTKFSSGNVFVLGGSSGLTGAPSMAALAAMRSGRGLRDGRRRPRASSSSFTVRLLEAMMVGLPETDGALSKEAVGAGAEGDRARRRRRARARAEQAARARRTFAREMFERIDVPLVIDADGLNALAGCFPEDLPTRPWPTVLTPHAGELGRLLDVDSARGRAPPPRARARAAAQAAKAFVVLKGDDTLVASPERHARRSRAAARRRSPPRAPATCSPGVIGAMLAKGLAPAHAACAGVYAHVRAGQLAAAPHGPDGVIASDVIRALPAALSA